jgi:hypothetical protein
MCDKHCQSSIENGMLGLLANMITTGLWHPVWQNSRFCDVIVIGYKLKTERYYK